MSFRQLLLTALILLVSSFVSGTLLYDDLYFEASTPGHEVEACAGDGWTTFKDEKCFKLINTFLSHDNAVAACAAEVVGLEAPPTLATPRYVLEQDFIARLVFDKFEVESNVWLGANRVVGENHSNMTFEWTDDRAVFRYTNWAIHLGAPTPFAGRACVQMISRVSRNQPKFDPEIDGKWQDVTCSAGNYALCQKYQIWTTTDVQRGILNNRREIEALREELFPPTTPPPVSSTSPANEIYVQ